MYLGDGTALVPSDRLLRARVLEWMGFEQTHVDGVISRARFRRMYPDAIPTREEEFIAWYDEGRSALAALDAHLTDRQFLVDERFTIADIALFAYTHCADRGGFALGPYASLQQWFAGQGAKGLLGYRPKSPNDRRRTGREPLGRRLVRYGCRVVPVFSRGQVAPTEDVVGLPDGTREGLAAARSIIPLSSVPSVFLTGCAGCSSAEMETAAAPERARQAPAIDFFAHERTAMVHAQGEVDGPRWDRHFRDAEGHHWPRQ